MTTIRTSPQEYSKIMKLMLGPKKPTLDDYKRIFSQNDPRLDTIVICSHHETPMQIVCRRSASDQGGMNAQVSPVDSTKLRIRVAELCGLNPVQTPFTPRDAKPGHDGDWFTPEAAVQMRATYPRGANPKIIPDYCNDLNACHEFEKLLTIDQCDQFDYFLFLENNKPEHAWPEAASLYEFHATAEQRCRAFVATMEGKL
jgi:hypothetical protein